MSNTPQYGSDKKFTHKDLQRSKGAEEQGRKELTPIDSSSPLPPSPGPLLCNTPQSTILPSGKNSPDFYQVLLKYLNIAGPIAGFSLAIGSIVLTVATVLARSPQQLPVSAIASFGDNKIELEVASSPKELEYGLKFRSSLPQNRGMLFEIGKPQKVRFWMKDVAIALDIVFIQPDGSVNFVAANAPPCHKEPCPLYYSTTAVNRVLELKSGAAKQLGIKPGTTIQIKK